MNHPSSIAPNSTLQVREECRAIRTAKGLPPAIPPEYLGYACSINAAIIRAELEGFAATAKALRNMLAVAYKNPLPPYTEFAR